ncbi:MAG TPA: EAL domain-containing protein [Actinomycetota bacterium]|nr:EAL domain-containing protein [Actinomycetota bacterium]
MDRANRRQRILRIHVATVLITGGAVLAVCIPEGVTQIRFAPLTFGVLASFVALGELMSIRVRRTGGEEEISTSATFSFALLLLLGTSAAVLAQILGSLIGDSLRGNRPQRSAFNAAQLAISLGLAGLVLEGIDPAGPLTGRLSLVTLAGLAAAGIVFYLVNTTVTGVAVGLSSGVPILRNLVEDAGFHAFIDAILIGLAPVVVVVAQNEIALTPFLALPMVAVGQSARRALDNQQLAEELRNHAAEKEHMALHDALTGLPNRTLFQDRIEQAIRDARRDGASLAVAIMDLDRFKEINDTLGHHNGDRALKELAARLSDTVRERDTVARLGGDEFGILLPGVQGGDGAHLAAERILEVFGQPFSVSDLVLEMGASVGIAVHPQHGMDAEMLLQRADVAMYAAKETRRAFALYEPELDRYSPDRLRRIAELRSALEDGELVCYYQPKLDLRTDEITGVEALVRWEHPRHGLLPPAEFVPLAEYTGLIRPLTTEVLSSALRELREWRRHDGFDLHVAVNLSTHSLLDPKLPEEVRTLLEVVGGDPSWLELELTESSIMSDPARSTKVLDRLADLGVSIAIDDFGTGYSSLAYLKALPVTTLKIDRSFVMSMGSDQSDATIVRSIIDLGANLGLRVVAEGVETADAMEALRGMGCDVAQGYHLARPMPGTAVRDWLLDRRNARTPAAV